VTQSVSKYCDCSVINDKSFYTASKTPIRGVGEGTTEKMSFRMFLKIVDDRAADMTFYSSVLQPRSGDWKSSTGMYGYYRCPATGVAG